jgi:DNA-binding MarR family transcriptional regulator
MIQREPAARLYIESPTLTRYLTGMEADGLSASSTVDANRSRAGNASAMSQSS